MVGLGRSPYVAAAITSLLGTSAEALIGPLSEPSITIEVGDLRGGLSGTTFKDDRRIVLAADEPLAVPVAGGVLAHQMIHLTTTPDVDPKGRADELIATVVGSLAYADQVITQPELATLSCGRIRGENSYLLTMINGSRGPTIDVGDVTPRTPALALFPYLLTAGSRCPMSTLRSRRVSGPWLASHGQELTRELYDGGGRRLLR